jgi:cytoskeleton protein RodZ
VIRFCRDRLRRGRFYSSKVMRKVLETPQASASGAGQPSVGDVLRGERATQGKSLLDVERDLRIKAAYLDAIENAELASLPNPAFVPGYVRSYARHLNLDPDEIYDRLREEGGFRGANQPARAGLNGATPKHSKRGAGLLGAGVIGTAESRIFHLPNLPFAAIGSLLVLAALVAGLGYGGWMVIQNIQRVQFAPVDELPVAVAEIEALPAPAPNAGEPAGAPLPELASPVAAKALVELYRAQELEVPILVPRDGPIAALDPDQTGLLAERETPRSVASAEGPGLEAEAAAGLGTVEDAAMPQVTPAKPRLTVLAERPAWIRVYLEDGTILFERILESGEVYEVPDDEPPPLIWAGNSGSVYVQVDQALHGPLGPGTRAVRDVALASAAIAERYGRVEEVPQVISESIARLVPPAEIEPAVIQ